MCAQPAGREYTRDARGQLGESQEGQARESRLVGGRRGTRFGSCAGNGVSRERQAERGGGGAEGEEEEEVAGAGLEEGHGRSTSVVGSLQIIWPVLVDGGDTCVVQPERELNCSEQVPGRGVRFECCLS